MNALTIVFLLLAGALMFAAVIAIYITNVTVKQGGIPRWVLGLGLAALLAWFVAVLTVL